MLLHVSYQRQKFAISLMRRVFKHALQHELTSAHGQKDVFLANMAKGFFSIPEHQVQLAEFWNKCWNYLESDQKIRFWRKSLKLIKNENEEQSGFKWDSWDEDHRKNACVAMMKYMIPCIEN